MMTKGELWALGSLTVWDGMKLVLQGQFSMRCMVVRLKCRGLGCFWGGFRQGIRKEEYVVGKGVEEFGDGSVDILPCLRKSKKTQ